MSNRSYTVSNKLVIMLMLLVALVAAGGVWLFNKAKSKMPFVGGGNASTNTAAETQSGDGVVNNGTRGMRNNNPFNIKYNENNSWQGQMGFEGPFVIFTEVELGIRAGLKLLKTYYTKHGLKNIHDIISRWAPHEENPTYNYINLVSGRAGIDSSKVIDGFLPMNKGLWMKIACAMIEMENGAKTVSVSKLESVYETYKNDINYSS